MTHLPRSVTLIEVGPRDGLQNETQFITTEDKLQLIHLLKTAGLKHIEATSFVSPQAIPQMADASELLAGLDMNDPTMHYPVLVPNIKGLEAALAAGAKEVSVFGAPSNTFLQKNIGMSVDESLEQFAKVIRQAKQANCIVRGYVSCIIACPYEGQQKLSDVIHYSKQLFDLGCDHIGLGDTIGVGCANEVGALIQAISQEIPVDKLGVHFHDTYGQALTNIYAALECGITTIDCSVSGLGGCPYATGASGNVATEDVVYLLDGLGIACEVNLDKLVLAGTFIDKILGRKTASKVHAALSQQTG